MAKKISNYVEVTPAVPVYVIDENHHLARVLKYLIDISDSSLIKIVYEEFQGKKIDVTPNHLWQCMVIPSSNDTISDVFVYELFNFLGLDKESTINEFKCWGIDKVYSSPYNGKVLGIGEFIDRVKEHFVDKDKLYCDASDEDKQCIFEE